MTQYQHIRLAKSEYKDADLRDNTLKPPRITSKMGPRSRTFCLRSGTWELIPRNSSLKKTAQTNGNSETVNHSSSRMQRKHLSKSLFYKNRLKSSKKSLKLSSSFISVFRSHLAREYKVLKFLSLTPKKLQIIQSQIWLHKSSSKGGIWFLRKFRGEKKPGLKSNCSRPF